MNLNILQVDGVVIRHGRVIDPSCGRDEIADVFINRGVITTSPPSKAVQLDATGLIICPGLSDMHVHLREPGQTHKETIETGSAAAAAGGFTFLACMPNTSPPLDQPDRVRFVLDRAKQVDLCEVGVVACITRDRAGREVVDLEPLLEAGAVAFSDDGNGVEDDDVMREAFVRAAAVDALIIQHCEYKKISAGGVMHLGDVSRRLNLPGLDPRSEEAMIERDLQLARETGARYHVAHISTAKAVDRVRRAKAEGVRVSAEVCTHHLLLTDEACAGGEPNTKMHPPLRPQTDVDACRQGLLDGTIDCIVTDHAPHTADEKALGFLRAPAGIVGLETAVGVAAKAMGDAGLADWARIVDWMTTGSERILRRNLPGLAPEKRANVSLVDPKTRYVVDPQRFRSQSRNSPFSGCELPARAVGTIRGTKVVLLPESELQMKGR